MKDIKILIRFDEAKNRLGFVIDMDKEDKQNQNEIMKLIAALEILKQREMSKIVEKENFKL